MKICVFGNKYLTKDFLAFCHDNACDLTALITLSDKAASKTEISGADNTLYQFANEAGLEVFLAPTYALTDPISMKFFASENYDLGIALGWQRLIPEEILNTFKYGVFGWHGSLFEFPNGRGRSPINWSIRLGGEKIFLNFFRYNAGVDDGNIFETVEIPIEPQEYIQDVQAKVLDTQKSGFLRLLKAVENEDLTLKTQPKGPFVTFPKLNELSGLIEVRAMTCRNAFNIIRSCSHPFPGAFIMSQSGDFKLRIWRAKLSDDKVSAISNYEIGRLSNGRLILNFCDGALEIEDYEVLAGEISQKIILR